MTLPAPDTFSITRRAPDPRADGATRFVKVSAAAVTIDRTFDGIRMRLGVPTAAYRELVICVRASGRGAARGGASEGRATLRLRHDDEELDAVIGSGEAEDVARTARAWSVVTGKPVRVEFGGVQMRQPHPRARQGDAWQGSKVLARQRIEPSRRGRFARRRKTGVPARLATSFAGEREIIARD